MTGDTSRPCDYCGSWSESVMQYYSWCKGRFLARCYECDRRVFDAQMTTIVVVLVLIAAVVCAVTGTWSGPRTLVIPAGQFERR